MDATVRTTSSGSSGGRSGGGQPACAHRLPLLSTGLTGVTLVFAVIALRRCYWGLVGRPHYLLVGLVGVAFLGSLHYWNLLGFEF